VPLKTGGTVRVQIWDTAGQERFKAITSAHYRKSLGALLVYDITKEQTFKNIEKWINEVKDHAEPEIVLMLVGNKLDICQRDPSERAVSTLRAEEFASKYNLLFIETSAFTDTNVRDSFETLV
jgi:Rab family protein